MYIEKAKEYSEKIPFLSSDEEGKQRKQRTIRNGSKLTELKAEVKVREAAIADLQTNLEGKDQEIEKLELEKEQLEMQIDEFNYGKQTDNKREFKEIVKTYETMSAKKAAPIITQMNDNEALEILSHLKPDTLAAIMEQMNATDAAKFTTLLTKQE